MFSKKIKWIYILLISTAIYSCAPNKNAAYFRHDKYVPNLNAPDKIYKSQPDTVQIIQIGDELFVGVSSGDDIPNSFNATIGALSADNLSLITYAVDPEGYITLPHLKRIKAEGLTTTKLAENIEQELSQYLYQPSVKVQIINKRVTVLGLVNAPGVYTFNLEKISIFEVIAMAGDIQPFGNRKKVLIIRNENNEVKKKYIDITNDEIVKSVWYNVKDDDIIYIEPLGRKAYGLETFTIFDLFSLITGTFAVYILLTSLGNN